MRTALTIVTCAVLTGCASRSPDGSARNAAPATASSSTTASTASSAAAVSAEARAARCAGIADSVRSSTAMADLPVATPRGNPRLPLPRGPVSEVHTTFLVDPAGRVVAGTVKTVGGDSEYRSQMESVVLRTVFQAPLVRGCPSWGRGDFLLRSELEVRTVRVSPG